MTDNEIEAYRKRLNDLTAKRQDGEAEQKLLPEFVKLAGEVGASKSASKRLSMMVAIAGITSMAAILSAAAAWVAATRA